MSDAQTILAKESQLSTDVDTLVANSQALQGTVTALQSQVASLQAQLAAGSPVTAADLANISSGVDAIDAKVRAALPPAPVSAPAPAPAATT